HEGLHQRTQARLAARTNQLRQHGLSLGGDPGHMLVENRLQEPLLVAEMILTSVGVALASRLADLVERDAVDAALGEQSLGDADELGARRKAAPRRGLERRHLSPSR